MGFRLWHEMVCEPMLRMEYAFRPSPTIWEEKEMGVIGTA